MASTGGESDAKENSGCGNNGCSTWRVRDTWRGRIQATTGEFQRCENPGLGLSGGSLDIVLSVYNPNGFNLNATRLTYKLAAEDKDLASGVLDHAFRVKDRDSTFVTIPVDFTYAALGAAGRQLLEKGSVNYRVIGDITVDTQLGNFTVPYDRTGRFSSFGSTR